jgi:hypothetical protein
VSHQLWDRGESSRDAVALGDLTHSIAGEAELLGDGLKGQATASKLNDPFVT